MPTTAKTGTKQVKTTNAPEVDDTVDQSGFLPRRIDADGVTWELHRKSWVKVDD